MVIFVPAKHKTRDNENDFALRNLEQWRYNIFDLIADKKLFCIKLEEIV